MHLKDLISSLADNLAGNEQGDKLRELQSVLLESAANINRIDGSATKRAAKPILMIYIWERFAPDHKDGLAFAIATNPHDARDMVIKKLGYAPSDWGPMTVLNVADGVAFAVTGGQ